MIHFPAKRNGEYFITPSHQSSAGDFDFLIGSWAIRNRKLASRFANCNEWQEFDATGTLRKILHGLGNIDDFATSFDGKPFEGMSLRIFNPDTKLWKIYWADTNTATLDTPVVGSFDGNVGHFFGTTLLNGKEVWVVFQWNKSNTEKPVWSQAFSNDRGSTWEWNWYMEFTRQKEQTDAN